MEPPTKRRRIDEDSDLGHFTSIAEPDEAPSFAGLRLKFKSRLEAIFDKYDKDFTGVGDEVDIQTGEVVVDNGHLAQLPNEDDFVELASDDEWGTDSSDEDVLGLCEGPLWRTPQRTQQIGLAGTNCHDSPSNARELPVSGRRRQPLSQHDLNVFESFKIEDDFRRQPRIPSASDHDDVVNVADPKWQFPQVPHELFTSKKFIPRLASEGPIAANVERLSHQTPQRSAQQGVSNRERRQDSHIFWTDGEIEKLKHLRLVEHKSFPALLHHFPNRSHGSIVGFWGRLKQKENLVDTTGKTKQLVSDVFWTDEEIEKLKCLRLQTKASWPVIAQHFPKRSARSLIAYWFRLNHQKDLGHGSTTITPKPETTNSSMLSVASRKDDKEELIASGESIWNEASNTRLERDTNGSMGVELERIFPSPSSTENIFPSRNQDHPISDTLHHLPKHLPNKEDWLLLPDQVPEEQPSVIFDFDGADQLPSPSNFKTAETPECFHEPAEEVHQHFLENIGVARRSCYGFADELMQELIEAANGDTESGGNLLSSAANDESLTEQNVASNLEMEDPESELSMNLESELSGGTGSKLPEDFDSGLPGGPELELSSSFEATQIPDLDNAEPNISIPTPMILHGNDTPTEASAFQILSEPRPNPCEDLPLDDSIPAMICGPSCLSVDPPKEKCTPSPQRRMIPVLPSISRSKSGSRQSSQESSTPGALPGNLAAIASSTYRRGLGSASVETPQEKKFKARLSNSGARQSSTTASRSKTRAERKRRKRRSKGRLSQFLDEIPSTSQPSSFSLSSLLSDDSEDELSFNTPTAVARSFTPPKSARKDLTSPQCGAGKGDVCMRSFCLHCMSSDSDVGF